MAPSQSGGRALAGVGEGVANGGGFSDSDSCAVRAAHMGDTCV